MKLHDTTEWPNLRVRSQAHIEACSALRAALPHLGLSNQGVGHLMLALQLVDEASLPRFTMMFDAIATDGMAAVERMRAARQAVYDSPAYLMAERMYGAEPAERLPAGWHLDTETLTIDE